MTRTLARLVLCLLIAALPLQSYAAVARVCCMAMAGGAAPAPAMSMQTGGQGDLGHCHHPQAQHAAGCVEHQHAASDHGACHASCAVCAACCVAFLTASPTDLPSPLLPSLSLAAPAATPLLTGPVPAGLERPPRQRAA